MRSVIIASILFIILLTSTLINSFFITSASDELILTARSVPEISSDSCLNKINNLKTQWNKFKKAALFTVSYSELSKISCLIEELYVHFYDNNEILFDYCLRVILSCLEEISRFERLSLDAIF